MERNRDRKSGAPERSRREVEFVQGQIILDSPAGPRAVPACWLLDGEDPVCVVRQGAGFEAASEVLREAALAHRCWSRVEEIASREGWSVEIVFDNPDAEGPGSLVIVRDCYELDAQGHEVEHRFTGANRVTALSAAVQFCRAQERAWPARSRSDAIAGTTEPMLRVTGADGELVGVFTPAQLRERWPDLVEETLGEVLRGEAKGSTCILPGDLVVTGVEPGAAPVIPAEEPRRLSDDDLGGRAALESAGLEPVDGWDDERGELTPEQEAALGSGAACVPTCEICERPLEGLPGDSLTCHHDCRIKVIEAMESMGGGFVSRLAMAWMRADDDNHERLRSAFPEYWEQYAKAVRS